MNIHLLDFEFAKYWVVTEIIKELNTCTPNTKIDFLILPNENKTDGIPTGKDQERIIRYLENEGVLRVTHKGFQSPFMNAMRTLNMFQYDTFTLEIFPTKFNEFTAKHKEMLEQFSEMRQEKKSRQIEQLISAEFDSNKSELVINNTLIKIPMNSDLFSFCKIIFAYQAKHYVGWDVIFEEIEKVEPDHEHKSQKTKIQDIVKRLNKKIALNIKVNPKLFVWHRGSVLRSV